MEDGSQEFYKWKGFRTMGGILLLQNRFRDMATYILTDALWST